jgi:hypothetical protein
MTVYGLLLIASNLLMTDMARLHTYIRPLELSLNRSKNKPAEAGLLNRLNGGQTHCCFSLSPYFLLVSS